MGIHDLRRVRTQDPEASPVIKRGHDWTSCQSTLLCKPCEVMCLTLCTLYAVSSGRWKSSIRPSPSLIPLHCTYCSQPVFE